MGTLSTVKSQEDLNRAPNQPIDYEHTEPFLDKILANSTNDRKNKENNDDGRSSLPGTKLKETIIINNVNENRNLQNRLVKLWRRREKAALYMDISRRAFQSRQENKREKWRREDEETVASWNLPTLVPPPDSKSQMIPHAKTMYTMTVHNKSENKRRQPVLPMLKIKRERTEIVTKGDKTFLARLPEVVEIDTDRMEHYNSYTKKSVITWSNDQRFLSLTTGLQPTFPTKLDRYQSKRMVSSNTPSRFSECVSHNGTSTERKQDAIVAIRHRSSRPGSLGNSMPVKLKSVSGESLN